jgi:hypothetical protein
MSIPEIAGFLNRSEDEVRKRATWNSFFVVPVAGNSPPTRGFASDLPGVAHGLYLNPSASAVTGK